jgi:hypothetical protein
MMNGYDMTGWGWFSMALMLIVILALIALVVWAVASRP